jgi:hypothetical protein
MSDLSRTTYWKEAVKVCPPDLVIVHSAKVADDVDDAEDKAALGEHGQVGAALVAIDRVFGAQVGQEIPNLHVRQPQTSDHLYQDIWPHVESMPHL